MIWTRKYHKTGDFSLYCPLTTHNLNLLQRENIIYKQNDKEAGYIETRKLTINEEGKEQIEIKGKLLTGYLNRRINWGRINFKGKTEELMRKLVLENAINPENSDRKIDNLILGNLKGFSETIEYQNSFGNVLEQLENISNTSGLGYRNLLDIKNKKIIFDVYKGIDRTIGNGTIAPCIFSRDFENILEQEFYDSLSDYKNTALIAGTGEGEERKIAFIEKGQGLDRYEMYVDARDIEDEEDGKPISNEEYILLLLQRGKEKLAKQKEIMTFDSKVNTRGNNIYKKDYDLGDIVTVVDNKWKLRVDTRITEIEEVYEREEMEINPVFGNNIPVFTDIIKREVIS